VKKSLTCIALLAMAAASLAEVVTIKVAPQSNLATLQPAVTYTDIPNGFARAHLMMDIIKPATNQPTPAIVFVSGNGWRSVDRAALIPQLAPFAKAGYLVAAIDYRIIGEATFPEPLKDVKSAIRFLRANAKKYNINPDRIGVWGNSAGGHLSGLVATTGDRPEFENDKWPGFSSAVQCAVLWYAPVDLADQSSDPLSPENMHLGLITKDPANASKVALANPASHVSDKTPPIMLVHGTADPVVNIRQSERMYQALMAANRPATFVKVEGAGHSFGQVSSTPEVMSTVLAFFDTHLKGK
jgi:acetyl esterase/lipase